MWGITREGRGGIDAEEQDGKRAACTEVSLVSERRIKTKATTELTVDPGCRPIFEVL